jgi:hypothetical protein
MNEMNSSFQLIKESLLLLSMSKQQCKELLNLISTLSLSSTRIIEQQLNEQYEIKYLTHIQIHELLSKWKYNVSNVDDDPVPPANLADTATHTKIDNSSSPTLTSNMDPNSHLDRNLTSNQDGWNTDMDEFDVDIDLS